MLEALYLAGVGGWMDFVPCWWTGIHYLMVTSHISYVTSHIMRLFRHVISYAPFPLLPLLLFTSLAAYYALVTITAISSAWTLFFATGPISFI